MTTKANNEFREKILQNYPLDVAVEWINQNLDPQDVFGEQKLIAWAENNGYTKE